MRIDWISENLKGYLEEPVEVEFSKWIPWERRDLISDSTYPGVYLIARFDSDEPPDGPAIHMDAHIVYIGMTGTRSFQTMKNRLSAFHRSVFEGKSAHAGGNSYRNSELSQTTEGLYVAAFAHTRPLKLSVKRKAKVEVSREYLEQLKRQVDKKAVENAELGDVTNCAWRLYVERRCLFEFALANNGKLPLCNKE